MITQIKSGLRPNKTEHAVFIDFETVSALKEINVKTVHWNGCFSFCKITGSPINAAKRLQFNLDVVPVPEVECMKNLREVVMPLFWVEEAAALNKTFVNILKYQLFLWVV